MNVCCTTAATPISTTSKVKNNVGEALPIPTNEAGSKSISPSSDTRHIAGANFLLHALQMAALNRFAKATRACETP